MASVRVELDVQKVMRKIGVKAKTALPILANQIRDDCNRYVRVYTGAMRSSSATASDMQKGLIVWNTPYAKRMYYTGHPSKDINGEASLRWCEKAKSAHLEEWKRLAQKEMSK